MTDTAGIVRIHVFGGADVVRVQELPLPQPGPGEVRVWAIGLDRA